VYYGGWGTITKVSTSSFQVLDIYTLPYLGSVFFPASKIVGGAIDSIGKYAYFVTAYNPSGGGYPGIVKIDLDSFTQVSSLALPTFTNFQSVAVTNAVIIDQQDQFLYVASVNSPAIIAKIKLLDFTLDSTLTLNAGENDVRCGIVNAQNFGYFATYTSGTIVRVNLTTMTRTGALSGLDYNVLFCSAIDYGGNFGYFAGYRSSGSAQRIYKIDLSTSPDPGFVATNGTSFFATEIPTAIAFFPTQQLLYAFCTPQLGGTIYRVLVFDGNSGSLNLINNVTIPMPGTVDFNSFTNTILSSAYAPNSQQIFNALYFPKNSGNILQPTTLLQINASPFQISQTVNLPLGILSASQANLDPTGTFMYIGSSSTYTSAIIPPILIKVDVETYEPVGSALFTNTNDRVVVTLNLDSTGQYAYAGLERVSSNEAIYKVETATMSVVNTLTLSITTSFRASIIDRTDTFLYLFYFNNPTSSTRILKINVNTMSEVGAPLDIGTVGDVNGLFFQPLIDSDNQYMYIGSFPDGPNANGVVHKIDLSTFSYLGYTSLWTGAPTQFLISSELAVYDPINQMGYFASRQYNIISKLDLSTPLPTLISQLKPNSTKSCFGFRMEPSGKYAYMYLQGNLSFDVVILDLELFQTSIIVKDFPLSSLAPLQVMDPLGRYYYWVTSTAPLQIVRMNLTNSLLSGLSTNAPSNLQNTTDIVDIDYKAQVAKLRSTSQIQNLVQPRYLGLYLKGSTGDVVDPDASFTFHTRLKVYPN
jgi:hypothetical protein